MSTISLQATAAPPDWPREAAAGLAGAATALATILTMGLLAYAPAGAAAAAVGMPAAFAGAMLGGAAMAAIGRSSAPCANPSSATTLLLAALVGRLCADPALDLQRPGGVAALVALCGLSVVLAGLLQAVMAAARLGTLARDVPQPVVAGFMNGVALLILVAQLPLLAGVTADAWQADRIGALLHGNPLTLGTGLLAAAVVFVCGHWWPRAPVALLGLAAGTLLCAWSTGVPRVGPLPDALQGALPLPTALGPLFGDARRLLAAHLGQVLQTAALLGLVGALESALGARVVDQNVGARHDPNCELLALGAANVVSGLFGGLPVVFHRLRALSTQRAGGRSWRAAFAGALVLGAAFVLARPLIEPLPLAALAGIMLTAAWALIDGWTRDLALQRWRGDRSPALQLGLVTVAAVCVATLVAGFVAAVVLGVLLSMLLLMRGMRLTLLRGRYSAADRPSRRIYPAVRERFLASRRVQIEVLVLEGALFFGSIERLAQAAQERRAEVRFLILDLQRVTSIDASGAVGLQQIARQLQRDGVRLWLAAAQGPRGLLDALRAYGTFLPGAGGARDDLHADADLAIEAAERALLLQAGLALDALTVAVADCELLQGLRTPQLHRVLPRLQAHALAAGERLFAPGDVADRLYILAAGSISLLGPSDAGPQRQRLVSLSPGMTLGEATPESGAGHATEAVADQPSMVYELDAAALAALETEDPALVARLWRNLSAHLAQRLRDAAAAWGRDRV